MEWLGGLHGGWQLILQLGAIVHLIKRGAPFYWLFVILMFGWLGAVAYILVEVVPDARFAGAQMFAGSNRKKRIAELETKIIDNPSPANFEELGELNWEEKQYAKAREYFDKSIAARSDSLHVFYHRGLCSMELGNLEAAIDDLYYVVSRDPKFDYHRAKALLAYVYGKAGHAEHAAALFEEVTVHSTTPETYYNYAAFLKEQGRKDEARTWAQKVLDKKRTLPRYMQRIEKPWFVKAKAMLKELQAA